MVQRYTGGPEPSLSPDAGLAYLLLFVLGAALVCAFVLGVRGVLGL